MQCSPSELNAIPVLEKVVPDLDDTVGESVSDSLPRTKNRDQCDLTPPGKTRQSCGPSSASEATKALLPAERIIDRR